MPFQLSPGVAVVEKDFTSIIPAVATSPGAFAGVFQWGPVLDPLTVTSENVLAERFGKPNNNQDVFSSFFTAANFLSYTNNLLVVRADTANQKNASCTGFVTSITTGNAGSGYTTAAVTFSAPQTTGGTRATGTASVSAGTTSAGSPIAVTGVVIAGTGGQFTCTATTLVVGQTVTITGTLGGTGTITSYTTGTVYKISSITGSGSSVTGFTLTTTGDAAIVTTAGTPTGLTYTANHPTVAGVVIAGTGGQFTCTATTLTVGDTITITGTLGGTGTITGYTTGKVYTVSALTAGSGSSVTGFTVTDAGTPIVTTAGTPTGLTYTRGFTVTTGAGQVSIAIVNPGSGYTAAPTITVTGNGTSASFTAVIQAFAAPKIKNAADYQATAQDGQLSVGGFVAKFPGSLGNSLSFSVADSVSYATWAYKDSFDSAPGTSSYAGSVGGSNDEMHIVVIDSNGAWTGGAGTILEKYAFVSKASDARKSDGTNNYYKNAINSNSRYLWWADHPPLTTWGTAAAGTAFENLTTARTISLIGGVDDFAATPANYQEGFALFANDELYDIALIPTGRVTAATVTYVINNIAEVRKDCIVFASPVDVSDASVITATGSTGANKITAFRDALPSTSYAVLDSGYKYQYDRYNDAYRYVPLNGDIAGLCARTDYTNDPWFSPGGMNRGQVKNVVKLAFNPSKVERDTLYKKGVNPVVAFPGQGTVLFGDKTLLAAPSAFDRINVRRLFIVLEKSVATAAKFQLFEFNDGFTRAQFKNLIEPFLRDVQGRRGITDFRVKCDDTNNTGEVIDRNEFVADIFIKPNRSINFITLNFVAARSSISFNEVGA
jgi:phage tail sheath protein FI